MRMKYISKIQSSLKKYKTIHTNKATSRILDGSYNSVYKGRSMDFDELREYVPGDDIKDVDWKASARNRNLLVKQYIAEKKHNIMLVMDTNKKMLGFSNEVQEKCEVALMCAGTLAYLVNRNGDYVSATYATKTSINHFPFRMGLVNIENILANYHKTVTMDNESDINAPLDYIIHNFRRKMIILIVTDIEGIRRISDVTLKRLMVMHDVLLVNISDVVTEGKNVYNIEGEKYLPEYFTADKKLAKIELEKKQAVYNECMAKLKKYGIASSTISDTEEIDVKIIELLNKHKVEKR
ncbi:MAG: DUF58 domain-containing protein [Coprococcus sp.]